MAIGVMSYSGKRVYGSGTLRSGSIQRLGESWKTYRLQMRGKGESSGLIKEMERGMRTERRPGSESPSLWKLRDDFYKKATGSRPPSPRNLLVNNAMFEPLILRTKAETKVAAERHEKRPTIVSKLPQTLRLEDVSKAIDLLESSSNEDCEKLSRQYIAELVRLSETIAGKFRK